MFIAELIIAWTIISNLIKFDKIFKSVNVFLNEAKPKIREITEIGRKISEQLVELVPIWVENIKTACINLVLQNLKSVLAGFGIWAIREHLKKRYKLGL